MRFSTEIAVYFGNGTRGTLKTRESKTGDYEKYGGRKRGTIFSLVEKAGPPSMERETDKYRCTAFIETLSNISLLYRKKNCIQSIYICISRCSKTAKIKLFINYKREMYALAH